MPAERGSDWFVLDSIDYRGHIRPAVGLTIDYAYRPLVTYNASNKIAGELVRDQLYFHLGGSMIFWERLRAAIDLPLVPFNDGVNTNINGTLYRAPTRFTLGDMSVAADARIFGNYGSIVRLTGGAKLFIPTGVPSQFTGDVA